jgi:hypothetical protein
VYDFVMTHKLDADDFFLHRVQRQCAERRLNFFLIEPLWVHEFFGLLERGAVWARVLLNMHSEHHLPEDIYHRLIWLAHARNVRVIDPPDVALAAFDKARLHPRLEAAGFQVPPSVIVPAAAVAGFRLTEADRVRLGSPFVVKPALGYGRRGLILEATSEADLARSRAAWPQGDLLLQRRLRPATIAGQPAYFRVYHAFGSTWLCWWNCYTDAYRAVSPEEEQTHGLHRLREIVRRLAALTGMRFFSSEIALTDLGEPILIDYVNDQCHLLSQGADPRLGVPDVVVAGIAERLVDGAVEWMGRRA